MKTRLATIALAIALTFGGQASLAQDFEKGLEAFNKRDYATALEEFRPLAEQGNVLAQYSLGVMYFEEVGVPLDYAEALKWFQLAAEQGDMVSQRYLGTMYQQGKGVPQDNVRAYMWHNIAASKGSQLSAESRDGLALKMSPDQTVEAQTMARECVARDFKGC